MARILVLALLFTLLPLCMAQDPMWVANRNSSDISQVNLWGETVQTVPLLSTLRSAHIAPDGKLWIVRFIQSTVDILNPDGTPFTTVIFSLGSAYDITFDSNGQAWISGGSGVEEYDPAGVSQATYPLLAPNALGITVDADGNKWVAHRNGPPGSVSRIDALTGAITNHAAPLGSNIQHTRVIADFRGVGQSSHIWAVGDSGSSLDEWDAQGTALNSYGIGSSLGSLAVDVAGTVWCGSFSGGSVYQIDPNTGATLTTFTVSPNCNGLAFDSFGRLWATARLSVGGPQPSEVRRLDPAAGTVEVFAVVGIGTQSALSTRHHHALVVDPLGDADGDFEQNYLELSAGTSPFDPQSRSFASLNIGGVTAVGGTATFSFATSSGTQATTVLAPATGLLPVGFGFPGVSGNLFLDTSTILGAPLQPLFIIFTGSLSFPLTVPPLPGTTLYLQTLTVDATQSGFANLTGMKIY